MTRSFVSNADLLAILLAVVLAACGAPASDTTGGWSGTVDTLDTGEVVVQNTDKPFWSQPWQVEEEWRIGSDAVDGPELFGTISSMDVDAQGRVHILDEQAQEVRVFDARGMFVRTIGRPGEGPGEFTQAGAVDISPAGDIWVVEMQQGRLSIFDSTGSFQKEIRSNSAGSVIMPYPGGFDRVGRYNVVFYGPYEDDYDFMIARVDQFFTPIDTIVIPKSPVPWKEFTHETSSGSMSASVPFQGSLIWRFSAAGNFWTLLTDRYELTEVTTGGDRLRTITKEYDPIPVTAADKEGVHRRLEWFTRQGGKVNLSLVPDFKPPVGAFFSDYAGNLWVKTEWESEEDDGYLFDVFDAEGRFLGELRLPFALKLWPVPIVRDGLLYGRTEDDSGAPVIVQARIVKP